MGNGSCSAGMLPRCSLYKGNRGKPAMPGAERRCWADDPREGSSLPTCCCCCSWVLAGQA